MPSAVSLGILFLAVQYRVPAPVIARMVFNIAVDSAVGSVPLAGDAFDAVWKSNQRNFTLLQRHRAGPPPRAVLITRSVGTPLIPVPIGPPKR